MTKISKKQAEVALFERFAVCYHARYGADLVDIAHGDKPDFLATDSVLGIRLGVEVTGAYQDSREAEINYSKHVWWGALTGSAADTVTAVNHAMAKKAEKRRQYAFRGPILLAVWIGSLVFAHESDFRLLAPRLLVPENQYSLISLILKSDSGPTLLVLQEDPKWREAA